jgi:hypothetical protein
MCSTVTKIIPKHPKNSDITVKDGNIELFTSNRCSKWAGICRYTTPELPFVSEFHTATYQYLLRYINLSFFRYSDGISLFLFQEVYRHF